MPGPAPKDASQRANKRPPVFGEWRDVPPLTEPVLPELEGEEWMARTRDIWEGWRQDPVTGMWGPSELAMAVELAHIYNEAVRARDKSTLWAEVRQWMDRLGLTPKGKRDLRLRITDEALSPAPVLKLAPELEKLTAT